MRFTRDKSQDEGEVMNDLGLLYSRLARAITEESDADAHRFRVALRVRELAAALARAKDQMADAELAVKSAMDARDTAKRDVEAAEFSASIEAAERT